MKFLLIFLAGCSTMQPGDELRIVHPISWHRVSQDELNVECREVGLTGCVVSHFDGDHIYTLPVCR